MKRKQAFGNKTISGGFFLCFLIESLLREEEVNGKIKEKGR